MKTSFKILLFAAAIMMASCAKWTTPEALDVKVNTIENTNPELYAQYLESIKAYKASDHHVTYVAFDNSAEFRTNAISSLKALPDSVDFVELSNAVYNDWTGEDMKSMREKFDTKFVIRISYASISAQMRARYGDEAYMPHIKDAVDSLIALADKYEYDGITVEYEGAGQLHALPDEIQELQDKEAQIFPSVSAWREKNKDKLLFFDGNPHHTVDHSVVLSADYVILPTAGEKSAQSCGYIALQAIQGEFADVNVILAANAVPDDITDTSTGRYFEGESLFLLTRWMVTDAPECCQKAGIAVYKVQNDCLSTNGYYPRVKAAIKTLNPNS